MEIAENEEANQEIVKHIRTTSSVSRSGAFFDKRRIERLAQCQPYAQKVFLKILSSQKDKGRELCIDA